jgi:glycosyltransferase involved in cell wall biosynthesis
VDGRVLQNRYHGIGRHTYELVGRLAERGVELVVVHDPAAPTRLDVPGLCRRGAVRLVPFTDPVVSPWAQPRWPGLLRAERPGVPTVTFVHDCIFESFPQARPAGRLFGPKYRAVTRLALNRSTAIATISNATRGDLARHYGVEVAADAVIPHGVGEQFASLEPVEDPARASRYILHVGVHRPHKNHATLLAGFARVAAELPDVRLVLVGQPDERFPTAVRDAAAGLGIADRVEVRVHVADDELLDLYRNASVFAFPSLVEGFGLPVLEAMAAGVPTVTSDAPAVVEAAAGASVVCEATDAAEWGRALLRVLTRPELASRLRAEGRAVARACTWDRSAERTETLLREVAGVPA